MTRNILELEAVPKEGGEKITLLRKNYFPYELLLTE
jgi:hypothetical protein